MKMNKKIIYAALGVLTLSISVIALNASALGNNVPGVATEQNFNALNEVMPKGTVYEDLSVEPEPFDYSNVGVGTETEIPENVYIPTDEDINILKDASKLRGDSKPKEFHDLTNRSYTYSLPAISSTYTNKYFNTNSSGEIRIQINDLYPYDKTFKIICYHVDGTQVSTWEGKPSDGYNALFYGLSTSSHYYFQFKAVGFASYLQGNGLIFH